MKKTNNRSTKEYFDSAIKMGGERLLHNPSKGEQALFVITVVLSFAALVLSAVTAIMSKDAMTIIRAFTENIVWFALVAALTVSDKVLVFRGRSLILILYALLALARDGFAFSGAQGIHVALAVLTVLSGIALYGTIIIDQFNGSDSPIKYWLIYGGSLYKLIYILVSVIVEGSGAAKIGVVNVLAVVANGFAAAAVILMLIYQFDGFSFIRYFFHEITGADDEEDEPEQAAEVASDYVDYPQDTQESDVLVDEDVIETPAVEQPAEQVAEQQPAEPAVEVAAEAEETVEQTVEETEEELIDDFGYVPYDDGAESEAVDNSVKPLTDNAVEEEKTEQQAYEAYEADLVDDEVLIDESVAEQVAAEVTPADILAALTPVERKYVSFAMKYHKPHDTLQVEGLSGDTFDVWVDNETICFLNDLNQASDGRGVRSAAIPFEDVQNIGFSDLGGGESCIVLSYLKGDVTVEIGFTKASFKNFKQVMMACAQ